LQRKRDWIDGGQRENPESENRTADPTRADFLSKLHAMEKEIRR